MTSRTPSFADALNAPIGEHQPKLTATTPGVTEASLTFWEEGKVSAGIWESTPGKFPGVREGYTEICIILSGRATIEVEGEEPKEFGPGDVFVTPDGWAGEWTVHEPIRKQWVVVQH